VPALLQAFARLVALKRLGVLLFVFAATLGASGTASALEPTQIKTRVWGFHFAEHNSDGLLSAATHGKHRGNRSALSEVASGSLLAAEGAGDAGQVFYRFGTSYETAARLGRQAAHAEGTEIGVLKLTDLHGVSVSPTVPSVPAGAATREAIEKAGFDLIHSPTAGDPLHHSLILPNPVTREIADAFNALFGRSYR
jgi:hypothetical protein